MESLEEAPRETQVATKSFVSTNAFLFVERLLDQQLSVSQVPGNINGQDRGSEGFDSQCVKPSHRIGPAGDCVLKIVPQISCSARYRVRP